jgi:hypothetical protein
MALNDVAPETGEQTVFHHWSARKLHPIIVVYVATVFAAFMAFSYFVVHSMPAVKALAITAVGAMFPLLPGVINRVEYRLTESGLEKRLLDKKNPRAFEDVFQWDQLSHVHPIKHGFKFYRPINESKAIRRFWKAHISDGYSGEFRVETTDRDDVVDVLTRHHIPMSKP